MQSRLLRGKAQIIQAKVPIIKCKLDFGGCAGGRQAGSVA